MTNMIIDKANHMNLHSIRNNYEVDQSISNEAVKESHHPLRNKVVEGSKVSEVQPPISLKM